MQPQFLNQHLQSLNDNTLCATTTERGKLVEQQPLPRSFVFLLNTLHWCRCRPRTALPHAVFYPRESLCWACACLAALWGISGTPFWLQRAAGKPPVGCSSQYNQCRCAATSTSSSPPPSTAPVRASPSPCSRPPPPFTAPLRASPSLRPRAARSCAAWSWGSAAAAPGRTPPPAS